MEIKTKTLCYSNIRSDFNVAALPRECRNCKSCILFNDDLGWSALFYIIPKILKKKRKKKSIPYKDLQ